MLIGRPVPSSVRHSRGAADNRKAQALAVGKPWSGQLVPVSTTPQFSGPHRGETAADGAFRARAQRCQSCQRKGTYSAEQVSLSRLAVYSTV